MEKSQHPLTRWGPLLVVIPLAILVGVILDNWFAATVVGGIVGGIVYGIVAVASRKFVK